MLRFLKKKIDSKINLAKTQVNLAYLHVPKTGGTYINQWESEDRSPVIKGFKNLGHKYVVASSTTHRNPIYAHHDKEREYTAVVNINELSNYVIFSNTRNPFSFLVSYLYHAGFGETNYLDTDHYDYQHAQNGFDYLLKTIADREDIWPNRKFLFPQFFASNGDFIVDWMNRQESLDSDLELFAEKYRVNYVRKEKQRIGGHRGYKTYYTDKLIDLVYETWGRELRLYGYEFDGPVSNYPSIYHHICIQTKRNLKYFWLSDQLFVNGHKITSRSFETSPLIICSDN